MLDPLSGDSEGKAVQMTLGLCIRLGHVLPIRTVFPLILGVMYILKPRLRLCLFVWLCLCRPDFFLWSVSDFILDLIHSEIVMIDLIPLFRHSYFLPVFLAPLEKTTTVMVSPIIVLIMLRESAVRNSGSSCGHW